MKRIKNLLLILVIFNVWTHLQAASISFDEAENIARNFIYNKTNIKVTVNKASVDTLSASEISIDKEYHIVPLNPKGWVIVSGDDIVEPILAYSSKSLLGPESSLPPAFIGWLEMMDKQIKQAKSEYSDSNATLKEKWNQLLELPDEVRNITSIDTVDYTIVGPLLPEPTWDQTGIYATLTPNNYPVGCVATATAQIMNYHSWPDSGVGSHSYVSRTNDYYLSVNFATTYNWTNMSDYDKAKISYHAGVSVDMDYTADGSGAYTGQVVDALRTYFKYSTDNYVYRSSYTDTTWHWKIKSSLDNNRPIIYRGTGPYGGHAWVCEGYRYGSDGSKMYHFNWGWGGYADGWFYITNLNPGSYTFTDSQAGIFNITPVGRTIIPSTPTTISASDDLWASNVTVGSYTVSGATDYKIYRANSADGYKSYLGVTSNLSYADTTAVPGMLHYYFVKACNTAGCSDYSDYNIGRRLDVNAAPPTPTTISASDDLWASNVTVGSYVVSGATHYKIYRANSADGYKSYLDYTTSLSYADTTAVPGMLHYYFVKACNSSECSGYSDYNIGRRLDINAAPPAPTTISASDDLWASNVTVGSYAVSGATYYKIYRTDSLDGYISYLGLTPSSSYADTTALPGKTYFYLVKACNSNGCSEYSDANAGRRLLSWSTGAYRNDMDVSRTMTVPGASSLNVRIQGVTESSYDFMYIYDSVGNEVGKYDGIIDTTIVVSGSSVRARFTSDYSVTATGVTVTVSER